MPCHSTTSLWLYMNWMDGGPRVTRRNLMLTKGFEETPERIRTASSGVNVGTLHNTYITTPVAYTNCSRAGDISSTYTRDTTSLP